MSEQIYLVDHKSHHSKKKNTKSYIFKLTKMNLVNYNNLYIPTVRVFYCSRYLGMGMCQGIEPKAL